MTRTKAVIDGRLTYTSASALNLHTACNRKYFFKYVLDLPDPAGDAADLGKEIHRRIETYLKGGPDVLGDLERPALEAGYIPTPGPDLLVEQSIDDQVWAGTVPMHGSIDLAMHRDGWHIKDWKSKGSIQRYIDGNITLGYSYVGEWLKDAHHADGRQMIAYAAWLKQNLSGRSPVRVGHVGIQTKGGKRALEWGASLTAQEIDDKWGVITELYVKPIIDTARADKVDHIPRASDEGYCFAYRKTCPYFAVCPQNASNFFQSMFNTSAPNTTDEAPMGILDQLMNDAPAIEEKATPAEPAVVLPEVTNDSVTTAPQASVTVPGGNETPPAPIPEAASVPSGKPRRGRPPKAKLTVGPAESPSTASFHDDGHTTIVVGPEAIEGAKQFADDMLAAVKATDPIQMAVDHALEVAEGVYRQIEDSKVYLYFGAAPIGVPVKSLTPYAQELNDFILQNLNDTATDVRLSEHAGLKFARWEAALQQAAAIKPPPGGHYAAEVGDSRVKAVAQAVAAKAFLVVPR